MPNVVGLDLGTTHCKAVAVDETGHVHAAAAREVTMRTEQPGMAAQRPAEVAEAAEAVLAETTQGAAAIVLSGAMHSVVPLDGRDHPLADAMTWADQRCEVQWQQIDAQARDLYPTTGCPSHTTYHPARLRWLNQHCRGHYVSLRDYVAHHLTGVWACDIGMASTTGLLDIHQRTWCDAALALAEVEADQLSPLVQPDAVIGTWRNIPVIIGTSDGALANVGAGAAAPGRTVITIGTSGAVRYVADQPVLDAQQRTWCYCFLDDLYLAGGAINNAGLLLKWLRKTCYADITAADPYDVMLAEASTIAPGAEGVTLLPYLSGERSPHYRTDLSASVHGLRLEHTRAHLARAAAEAVACCLRNVRAALPLDTTQPIRITGGVTRYTPWLTIVADMLDAPLEVIDAADASALGAALLGHRALNHVPNLAAWDRAPSSRIDPDPASRTACDETFARFNALQRAALASRS